MSLPPIQKPNVVDLVPRLKTRKGDEPESPVFIEKQRKLCIAHAFTIDAEEKTVECRKCGRDFMPLDALLHLAKDPTNWIHSYRHLKAMRTEAEETLNELKKQVAAEKAKLKHLREKAKLYERRK